MWSEKTQSPLQGIFSFSFSSQAMADTVTSLFHPLESNLPI